MNARSALLLVALIALLLHGCGDEREGARIGPQAPWPEAGAPDVLHALADDLIAYQRVNRRMPTDLASLDSSGLATAGPYATRGYAYHPTGIGILREGWRVTVADDRVREAGKVWCVLRPPARVNGSPGLRVALVPVVELSEAATNAGKGN